MSKRIISILTVIMLLVMTLALPAVASADSIPQNESASENFDIDNDSTDDEVEGEEEQLPVPTEKITIGEENVALAATNFTYTGNEIKPAITVTYNGSTLIEGEEYMVEYAGNLIDAGEGKVIVTGTGDYTGTVEKVFNISEASIAKATIKLKYSNYYYQKGKKIYPSVTVTYKGRTLVKNEDYKITYSDNIYPGKAKVTITGINNFTSSISKNVEIAMVSGLKVKTTGTENLQLAWSPQKNVTGYIVYKYSTKEKKYKAIKTIKGNTNVTYSAKNLKPGYGYKFMVKTYVAKGEKTYKGTGTVLSAATRPTQVNWTSLKSTATLKLIAKWKKVTATGYQVRVSTSSKFKSYKTHKVTSASQLSKTIDNLKDDTTYYVKVRAYKTYGGNTVYGKWSITKKTKTDGTGWVTSGGKKYYYKNGQALKGLKTIGGNQYYFNKHTGALAGVSETMWNKVKDTPSKTKWLVAISTKANRVCVYYGSKGKWVLKKYYKCTTGKPSTPTAKGTFAIPVERDRKPKFGDGYTCWYATRIVGNVYFHSVLYNPESKTNLQDGRLGQNLSHGCVRMALKDAKWIYDNIPAKTTVIIY